MGNCMRRQTSSSVQRWAGDDWEWEMSPERGPLYAAERSEGQKGNFIISSGANISSSEKSHKVKIKITKEQLEELLGRVDAKEVTVEQVLAHLMDVHDRFDAHQRSWRPTLQSIPEGN